MTWEATATRCCGSKSGLSPLEGTFFLSGWTAWAPGLPDQEAWLSWARGERTFLGDEESPKLEHLPPLFRRRLSQLTKMTLQVGYELLGNTFEVPLVFASRYGEIGQQLKISESLIESGEVSPSAFSLSVFNTAVAHLSIAGQCHRSCQAISSGPWSFGTAFLTALGKIAGSREPRVALLAGDEKIPETYRPLSAPNQPHMVGLLLEKESTFARGFRWSFSRSVMPPRPSPLDFLAWWLQGARGPFEVPLGIGDGTGIQVEAL